MVQGHRLAPPDRHRRPGGRDVPVDLRGLGIAVKGGDTDRIQCAVLLDVAGLVQGVVRRSTSPLHLVVAEQHVDRHRHRGSDGIPWRARGIRLLPLSVPRPPRRFAVADPGADVPADAGVRRDLPAAVRLAGRVPCSRARHQMGADLRLSRRRARGQYLPDVRLLQHGAQRPRRVGQDRRRRARAGVLHHHPAFGGADPRRRRLAVLRRCAQRFPAGLDHPDRPQDADSCGGAVRAGLRPVQPEPGGYSPPAQCSARYPSSCFFSSSSGTSSAV